MNNRIFDVIANKGDQVEVIAADDLVDAAVDRMNHRHVGSLLVIEDHKLVGILTERDLLVRVLAARLDPASTYVHDVMTREVIVIGPGDSVTAAMEIITRRRCRHLPVVDGGRICGLVSAGDLSAWLVRDQQQTIDDLHQYITR